MRSFVSGWSEAWKNIWCFHIKFAYTQNWTNNTLNEFVEIKITFRLYTHQKWVENTFWVVRENNLYIFSPLTNTEHKAEYFQMTNMKFIN